MICRETPSYRAPVLRGSHFLGAENSEVSWITVDSLVAVAVIVCLTAALGSAFVKEALPLALILTVFWPRNLLPSLPPVVWSRTRRCRSRLGC
jgi:hypothetical protein